MGGTLTAMGTLRRAQGSRSTKVAPLGPPPPPQAVVTLSWAAECLHLRATATRNALQGARVRPTVTAFAAKGHRLRLYDRTAVEDLAMQRGFAPPRRGGLRVRTIQAKETYQYG
jgi:hypothetical protein